MIRIVRLPLRQPSDMKGIGFEPIFAMSACFYLLYVSLIKFIKVNMTPMVSKIKSLVHKLLHASLYSHSITFVTKNLRDLEFLDPYRI